MDRLPSGTYLGVGVRYINRKFGFYRSVFFEIRLGNLKTEYGSLKQLTENSANRLIRFGLRFIPKGPRLRNWEQTTAATTYYIAQNPTLNSSAGRGGTNVMRCLLHARTHGYTLNKKAHVELGLPSFCLHRFRAHVLSHAQAAALASSDTGAPPGRWFFLTLHCFIRYLTSVRFFFG